jgi:hypothetical protein
VRYIPIVILTLGSSIFLVVSSLEIITLSKSPLRLFKNIALLTPVFLTSFSYLTFDQSDIVLQDYAAIWFFTQSLIYAIITAKLIVCAMAKANYSVF